MELASSRTVEQPTSRHSDQ